MMWFIVQASRHVDEGSNSDYCIAVYLTRFYTLTAVKCDRMVKLSLCLAD
jgi:hypothetical protein